MFERYTEKARRVIFFARYEASQTGAEKIEAEHILLGVLREDKVLAQALFTGPALNLDDLRAEITHRLGTGTNVHASVDMPLSPSAKRVLSYAENESNSRSHRHIGTDHLMLGLVREEGSFTRELLLARGVTADKVNAYVTAQSSSSRAYQAEDRHQGHETAQAPLWPQIKGLVDRLTQKGIVTPELFNEHLQNSLAERHVYAGFNVLLDVLVSKGVISEDEKRKISSGQS